MRVDQVNDIIGENFLPDTHVELNAENGKDFVKFGLRKTASQASRRTRRAITAAR
jgi:hypothetical protein